VIYGPSFPPSLFSDAFGSNMCESGVSLWGQERAFVLVLGPLAAPPFFFFPFVIAASPLPPIVDVKQRFVSYTRREGEGLFFSRPHCVPPQKEAPLSLLPSPFPCLHLLFSI